MDEVVCSPKPRWLWIERCKVDSYTRWTFFLFASQIPYSWKHKYRLIVSVTF